MLEMQYTYAHAYEFTNLLILNIPPLKRISSDINCSHNETI